MAHAPAIIVAPIWNVQPLITFSLARLLLQGDEAVTLKDGLAAVLVVAGVYFLFQSQGSGIGHCHETGCVNLDP